MCLIVNRPAIYVRFFKIFSPLRQTRRQCLTIDATHQDDSAAVLEETS